MMDFLKLYLDKVVLFNAEFSLYYDGEFKKLHLLDLDEPASRSVTNAASKEFLLEINVELINRFNHQADLKELDVYLYGTDGIICEYLFDDLGGEFKHTAPNDPHLYEPFKKICASRWDEDYKNTFGGF
jgi:hypothetical protein